jgi:DNA modification methylase
MPIKWHIKPGARHTFNSGSVRSIYSNVIVATKVPVHDRVHIAQKPVELTNFLISLLTERDDLIVDPFCGSGSTLVSAAICGRPWLGCDTDKTQCDIAATRTMRHELEEAELRPLHLWVNGRLQEVSA